MQKSLKYLAATLVVCLMTAKASALDVISYSSGEVTFNPGVLVTPVIVGVIAIVGAAGSIWVISAGVKWLRSFLKTR